MIVDVTDSLVIQRQTRDWCRLPYPGHPNGCPNYDRSEQCPTKIPLVSEIFDLSQPLHFIITTFDLRAHMCKMARKHPDWSTRQQKCCLYWQNAVRKTLTELCNQFINGRPNKMYTLIPEAMGVNVFRTAHRHKIMIRKDAYPIVYKVALVGTRKQINY